MIRISTLEAEFRGSPTCEAQLKFWKNCAGLIRARAGSASFELIWITRFINFKNRKEKLKQILKYCINLLLKLQYISLYL